MLKIGRFLVLSIGPVGFTLTMACIMAMLYFTMSAWLFQCCVKNVLSATILESTVSIQQISLSGGGGYTLFISISGWSTAAAAACSDKNRRSLCQSLCSSVNRANLGVLQGSFQNQGMLEIILLIFYDRRDFFISGLGLCVITTLFAYFGGYDNFIYSRGYLLLYLLILRCWGNLCSDSSNMSHGSYVHL